MERHPPEEVLIVRIVQCMGSTICFSISRVTSSLMEELRSLKATFEFETTSSLRGCSRKRSQGGRAKRRHDFIRNGERSNFITSSRHKSFFRREHTLWQQQKRLSSLTSQRRKLTGSGEKATRTPLSLMTRHCRVFATRYTLSTMRLACAMKLTMFAYVYVISPGANACTCCRARQSKFVTVVTKKKTQL